MRTTILALLVLASCALKGDGDLVEVSREVPPFTSIEVFDDFEVDVRVKPELGAEGVTVRVTAEANLIDRVFTEVHGDGVLSIAVNPNLRTELTRTPAVTIAVPSLQGVFASDRAIVRVADARGALTIESEGSSVVEATGLTEVVAEVAARGTSDVALAGAGPRVTIEVSEGARVDASALAAEAALVTVAGVTASATVCTTGAAPEIAGEVERVTVECAP